MLNKKIILLIILVGGVSFVLLLLTLFTPTKNKPGENIPSQTSTSSPEPQAQGLVSLTPDENTLLRPNERVIFVARFTKPLNPNNIVVSLKRSDIGKDSDQSIQTNTAFTQENKIISISFEQTIVKTSRYNLVIKDVSLDQTLLDRIFISSEPPQPAASNNPSLIPYLPYETSSFTLIWDPTTGKYVFHFRYNNNNPDSPTDQFEDAKQAAIRFIKSKGIDPNKITIEWKYS